MNSNFVLENARETIDSARRDIKAAMNDEVHFIEIAFWEMHSERSNICLNELLASGARRVE